MVWSCICHVWTGWWRGGLSCSSHGPFCSAAWVSSRCGDWLPPELVIQETGAEATMLLMTEPQESHASISTILSGVQKPALVTVGEGYGRVCIQEAGNTGCCSFPFWSTVECAICIWEVGSQQSGTAKVRMTVGDLPVRVGDTAPWKTGEGGPTVRALFLEGLPGDGYRCS